MITCKLCGTYLGKKHLSMLCPECGQVYWKAAVDMALSSMPLTTPAKEIESRYIRESRKSTELIRRARFA